jgi:tRNA-2-methylthio-N6-dimethylallyladenosine synthase
MRHVFIQTIGCQMNVYDSGKMLGLLGPFDYVETDSMDNADMVIVNTCAIREKSVQKVHSFIGRLKGLKKRKKNLIIIVAGCVAQQQGQELMSRFPHVDMVLGTHAINRLPDLVKKFGKTSVPVIDIAMRDTPDEFDVSNSLFHKNGDITRFVTIMRGCDNYCTYCVVPYVRGKEVSRRPDDILNEIEALVQSGIKEITLLGQNVNSYGIKEGLPKFPNLLEIANQVEGLKRIRFVTSHPKDLSDDLIESFSKLDKLCNHIHLPVQSGSNMILRMMNRKYTHEQYVENIGKLRSNSPHIAITTDIIVGFPGERSEDFNMTLQLMETVQFDNLFVFKYSDRPDTPSSHYSNKIPSKIKNQRLQDVLLLQKQISKEKDRMLVGKVFPVLVDGRSKKQLKLRPDSDLSEVELQGRTSENRIVNFRIKTDCGLDIDALKGQIINLKIDKVCSNSLRGTPVEGGFLKRKGDCLYVA